VGVGVGGSFPSKHPTQLVSEPDPQKIGKRVWEIGWGGSVPCAWNAGVLLIDS